MNKDNPKVTAVLDSAFIRGFTEQDFADLALAAADQAGMSVKEQNWLMNILRGVSYHTDDKAVPVQTSQTSRNVIPRQPVSLTTKRVELNKQGVRNLNGNVFRR